MNIEPSLARELHVVAGSVPAPPAPAVADLVRLAQRDTRRQRRRKVVAGSALVAATVAGAVLVGAQLGDPDAAPPPPAPQPTEGVPLKVGEPIRTWVDRYGKLHLDGVTVPGSDYADARTAGDLTTAAVGPYDTGTIAVFLGTTRVGTLRDAFDSGVVVSPDHRVLAYPVRDPASREIAIAVVRVDPEAGDGVTELGRLPVSTFTASAPSERERIYRVTDLGTVTYGPVVGSRGHTWTPGTDPVPADTGVYTRSPAGLPEENPDDANAQVVLSPDGAWGAWPTHRVPGGEDDAPTYTAVRVQQPGEPETSYTFDFAGRYAYVNVVFWETAEDLVLYADRNPPGQQSDGRYLRCSVTTDRCEVAPAPGED